MRSLVLIFIFVLSGNIVFAGKGKVGVQKDALILVLPVFGNCPPELLLPWAGLLAESLSLILPQENIKVIAQEPTEQILPGTVSTIARQRGNEIGANAVVWGELIPPLACQSSRKIRLRILDLETQELFNREVCPNQASVEDISRVLSLVVANALRNGVVDGIRIPSSKKRMSKNIKKIGKTIDKPACLKTSPCKCPTPKDRQEAERAGWLNIVAGSAFSSHPNWDNPGFGLELGLEWIATDYLRFGFNLTAFSARRIEVDDVNALYSSWPLSLYGKAFFESELSVWGVEFGGKLAWSRLDVLIDRLDLVQTVEEINPVVYARAIVGIKISVDVVFEFELGPSAFLRKQKYTYITPEGIETVLKMQSLSLDAGFRLLVKIF